MRLTSLLVIAGLLGAARPAGAASPCVTAAGNAQDLRAQSRLREARAALLVCSQRTCNGVVRADCERWLREIDAEAPSLVVRAVDARGQEISGVHVRIDDATLELDGRPVTVDPGAHELRAQARSGALAEQKVTANLGEKARVVTVRFGVALEEDGTAHVAPAPAAPAHPAPAGPPAAAPEPGPGVAPLVLGGIGGAALLAFAGFELAGQSGYSDLQNGCGRTRSCTDAEKDPVKAKFVGAGISLGVALVALGAAVITYATRAPRPAAVSLGPRGLVF